MKSFDFNLASAISASEIPGLRFVLQNCKLEELGVKVYFRPDFRQKNGFCTFLT